jgi:hypothetical protein
LPGSSSSFPTWPARGTRFALHQEISAWPPWILYCFFFNLLLTSEHMMSVSNSNHKGAAIYMLLKAFF